MNPLSETVLPDWTLAILDIPAGGLSRERSVPPDAMAEFAKTLGMLSLEQVTTNYRIDRLAGGGYRLHGRLSAKGEQACVVSLDPVAAALDEAFDVEFWPEVASGDGGEDKTILDVRDVETLENGSIPVGRVILETISAALDPYPRKPGAEFNWTDTAPSAPEKVSPFAALSKLKKSP